MKHISKTKSINIIDSSQHWDVDGQEEKWGGGRLHFKNRKKLCFFSKAEKHLNGFWVEHVTCLGVEEFQENSLLGERKPKVSNLEWRPESVTQDRKIRNQGRVLNYTVRNSLKLHAYFMCIYLWKFGAGLYQMLKGSMMQ